MAVNVKQSKYRYLTGTPGATATDLTHVQPSSAVWDCGSFIAANEKYIAVPWAAVGATAVFDMKDYGNCPTVPPMLVGHGGPILDLSFHPYQSDLLFTASEDATICGWRIPEGGLKDSKTAPIITMTGHSRKVGTITWHPSANNVLASAGPDPQVRLWDVTCSTTKADLRAAKEAVHSLNFNIDGTLLNTTTKDKRVNVVDSRTGDIVMSSEAHESSKTQRSVWAKRRNMIITTGFSKKQQREVKVWDLRAMDKELQVISIDSSPCVMAPYFDEDTDVLFCPGKGESSVNFFHLWMEDTPLTHVNAYRANTDQKGMGWLPKTSVNVRDAEIIGSVKLTTKSIQKIRWVVPRKTSSTEFQNDLYPPTFANTPAISADEFFAGKNAQPNLTSLEGKFTGAALETVAGSRVQDSVAAISNTNHNHRAPVAATVTPAVPVGASWNGSEVPSDEQLKTQSAYVAYLMDIAQKLDAAQDQYVKMAAKKPEYTSAVLAAVQETRALAASVSLETPSKKDKKEKKDKKDKKELGDESPDKKEKKDKKDKSGAADDADAEAKAKAKAAKKHAEAQAAERQALVDDEAQGRKTITDEESKRHSTNVKYEGEERERAKDDEKARVKREEDERKRKEAAAKKDESSSSSSSGSDSSSDSSSDSDSDADGKK